MLYDNKRWKMPEVPAEIELEPWRKILLKAADLIETKGWCRENYQSRGRYCVLGAIAKAAGYAPSDMYELDEHATKAEDMLTAHLGEESIPYWNDKQKSRKPVIEALRAAANN